jgi:hypothetical protein
VSAKAHGDGPGGRRATVNVVLRPGILAGKGGPWDAPGSFRPYDGGGMSKGGTSNDVRLAARCLAGSIGAALYGTRRSRT